MAPIPWTREPLVLCAQRACSEACAFPPLLWSLSSASSFCVWLAVASNVGADRCRAPMILPLFLRTCRLPRLAASGASLCRYHLFVPQRRRSGVQVPRLVHCFTVAACFLHVKFPTCWAPFIWHFSWRFTVVASRWPPFGGSLLHRDSGPRAPHNFPCFRVFFLIAFSCTLHLRKCPTLPAAQ